MLKSVFSSMLQRMTWGLFVYVILIPIKTLRIRISVQYRAQEVAPRTKSSDERERFVRSTLFAGKDR